MEELHAEAESNFRRQVAEQQPEEDNSLKKTLLVRRHVTDGKKSEVYCTLGEFF